MNIITESGPSETSSKGWKRRSPRHRLGGDAASETSSKGWKLPSGEVAALPSLLLPKLPLRDGNTGASGKELQALSASETSSKGWKLMTMQNKTTHKSRLPKLPLRDGNLYSALSRLIFSILPKLPLRDGNQQEKHNGNRRADASETSSKGWKLGWPARLARGCLLPKLPLRDGNPLYTLW